MLNRSNPLIPSILALLRQYPLGISEHEIMQQLGEHAGFGNIGGNGQLPLFQKHFLIMNGLYQLQQSLWKEEQLALEISPLKIALTTLGADDSGSHPAISDSAKLSRYYLNWRNLDETSENDVIELHQLFWERFSTLDGRADALTTLGLGEDASAETINCCYRKLAAEHHPDRGGCSERFIEIRQAYEQLKDFKAP
ncbi:MAG TPA: molecular chaperone DnaJ [Ectothiorhodospiraceae bacterium]|nr:molecular chaperone DnaJ [Ectothiorhodospiraceae bacterium]